MLLYQSTGPVNEELFALNASFALQQTYTLGHESVFVRDLCLDHS